MLLRTAFSLIDQVVAVSAAQGAWLVDRGYCDVTSLRVIRSCVDLSTFSALPSPTGPIHVIGAVGRLDRQKGFDTSITAFRTLSDTSLRLHVHGEGAERAALASFAAGDDRIRFFGQSADPVAVMAELDAVAMPSRWEAYGLVALEARAAGRALLISDVDGLRDHKGVGVVPVANGSVLQLASGLRKLVASGSPDRDRAAQEMAESRAAWASLTATQEASWNWKHAEAT